MKQRKFDFSCSNLARTLSERKGTKASVIFSGDFNPVFTYKHLVNLLFLMCHPLKSICRKDNLVALLKCSVFLPPGGYRTHPAQYSHIHLYEVIGDFRGLLTPTRISIETSFVCIIIHVMRACSYLGVGN